MGRYPWADATERLLVEKRLKGAKLAQLAGVPQSRISEMKASDRPFIPLMQKLADALGVPLWEFFVTEEQAHALRELERVKVEAMRKSQPASVAESLASMEAQIAELRAQLAPPAPITEAAPKKRRVG